MPCRCRWWATWPTWPTLVGLQILDVSNPAAVTLRGGYDTPGVSEVVQVVGNLAYVADQSAGLQILDVSNPAAVTRVGGYDTSGKAYDVQVVGNLAYVADGDGGLQILNVSNPAAVTRLGGYDNWTWAQDVQVVGSLAYLADYWTGLHILDVSNPASVTLLGSYATSGKAYAVEVLGGTAYVADGTRGVKILQVGTPAASISHVSGNTYRVGLGGTLAEANYALQLGPEILDLDGAAMDQDRDGTPREAGEDGYFPRFRVGSPPQVTSLSPADDGTGVAVNANLVIAFDESIAKGAGNVVIKRAGDGAVIQTIAVGNAVVSARRPRSTRPRTWRRAPGTTWRCRPERSRTWRATSSRGSAARRPGTSPPAISRRRRWPAVHLRTTRRA